MPAMRAKFRVSNIQNFGESEVLRFDAVCRNEAYPEDGSDENNTFAKFTPSAHCEMTIQNPALVGQFKIGQEFYVDFTEVEPKA